MDLCSFVGKNVQNVVPSVIKGHTLHVSSVTTESSRCLGGGGGEGGGGGSGLRCLTLTSMSRRLLHRRNDMRAGSRRECCFASL